MHRVRNLENDVRSIIANQDRIQAHVIDVESRVSTVEKQYDALASAVSGMQHDVQQIKTNNPQFVYKVLVVCMCLLISILRPDFIVIIVMVLVATYCFRNRLTQYVQ